MVPIWSLISVPPPVHPRLAELKEMSPLHGLGHLILDQSYVCALIAMMVRNSPFPSLTSREEQSLPSSPLPGHCSLLIECREVGCSSSQNLRSSHQKRCWNCPCKSPTSRNCAVCVCVLVLCVGYLMGGLTVEG